MGIGLAFGFLVVRYESFLLIFLIKINLCKDWREDQYEQLYLQGRMILAHLCDEPKGLKTNMALVRVLFHNL